MFRRNPQKRNDSTWKKIKKLFGRSASENQNLKSEMKRFSIRNRCTAHKNQYFTRQDKLVLKWSILISFHLCVQKNHFADSFSDGFFCCPRIKHLKFSLLILDSVEIAAWLSHFVQHLPRTEKKVPDIYCTLLYDASMCQIRILNITPKPKTNETGCQKKPNNVTFKGRRTHTRVVLKRI